MTVIKKQMSGFKSRVMCGALAVGLSLGASFNVSAAPALLGLYTFEGANGSFANVTDASGNGNNPNYAADGMSVTTGNGGYQGEAAKFTLGTNNLQYPGLAQYGAQYPQYYDPKGMAYNGGFTVPIDISPSSAGLTIGGWLRLDPNSTGQGLHSFFSQDNGGYDRGVWYNEPGNDWQIMGGYPHSTGAGFTTDTWHSVVVTYGGPDGLDAKIYIDGVLKGSTSTSLTQGEPNVRFGAYDNDFTTEPWSGLMDNLFVFSGALSADQVSTINTDGLAGIQSVAGISGGSNTNVPEPASLALLGLGLAGMVASRRRKSK